MHAYMYIIVVICIDTHLQANNTGVIGARQEGDCAWSRSLCQCQSDLPRHDSSSLGQGHHEVLQPLPRVWWLPAARPLVRRRWGKPNRWTHM